MAWNAPVIVSGGGTPDAHQSSHRVGGSDALPTGDASTPGLLKLGAAGGAYPHSTAGTMASQNANAVAVTGGSVTGITDLALADGGTGDSMGGPFALGSEVWEIRAPIAGQNYIGVGFPSAPGYNGAIATTAPVIRGRKLYAPSTANAATDGVAIGGFNSEANNRLFFCSTTSKWTAHVFLGTNAAVTFRGGGGMGNGNPTDVDKVQNNTIGVRLRPTVSGEVYAYATNNAGATTSSTLGLTLATNSLYVFRIAWDGGSASISYATITAATGVWSAFSTPVVISSNLPLHTSGLAPTVKWWNHGATQPTVDVGGCQVVPWLVA